MSEQKICQICKKDPHKYKCPGCLLKYCSVACYKEHKETRCKPTESKIVSPVLPESRTIDTESKEAREDGELSESGNEVTEDMVPKALLGELGKNPELLAQLENPHLRNMLLNVDSSNSAAATIHNAMLEPIFTEFADTCLKVVQQDVCNSELKILHDQCH